MYNLYKLLLFIVCFCMAVIMTGSCFYAGKREILLSVLKGLTVVISVIYLTSVILVNRNMSTAFLGAAESMIVLGMVLAALIYAYRKKSLQAFFRACFQRIKETRVIEAAALAAVLLATGYLMFFYHQGYYQDTYAMSIAADAYQSNQLYAANPYTGAPEDTMPWKLRLSPYILVIAGIARVLSIHPLILFHIGMVALVIPCVYLAWYAVASEFTEDVKERCLFLIILLIFNGIFVDYDLNANKGLLLAAWQGKIIVANAGLPLILFFTIRVYEKKEAKYWFYILCTIVASTFFSVTGIVLCPLLLMSLMAYYGLSCWMHKWKRKQKE